MTRLQYCRLLLQVPLRSTYPSTLFSVNPISDDNSTLTAFIGFYSMMRKAGYSSVATVTMGIGHHGEVKEMALKVQYAEMLRHFLVAKILTVRLISVYVTK